MSIVVKAVCKDCHINHLKDPNCGGDYTVEGKLLSFCPICGGMLPFLEITERERISNGNKRKVGTTEAKKHNLDYRDVYRIVKELYKQEDKEKFINSFCVKMKLEFGVVVRKEEIRI